MTVLNSAGELDAARAAGHSPAEQLLPGHPAAVALWGETDSSTLICRQVQDVTHDVKTFLFESAQPALFQHEPGQFVTLQLLIDGRAVSR
jgi:glycine betaine catabolism B